MRRLAQHAARAAVQDTFSRVAAVPARPNYALFTPAQQELRSLCTRCRLRTQTTSTTLVNKEKWPVRRVEIRRSWSSSSIARRDELDKVPSNVARAGSSDPARPTSAQPVGVEEKLQEHGQSSALDSTAAKASEPLLKDPTVQHAADEHLPSAWEARRWRLSKWFNKAMDDLMPKIAIASQRINTYTGTDYTGIEALRKEIQGQGEHSICVSD